MIVFQIVNCKKAIVISFMAGISQNIIISFFIADNCLVVKVKMVCKIFFYDFLLAISAGIIHNCTDKGKVCFLHTKAIHGIHNIWSMIIGHATNSYEILFIFHLFLSNFVNSRCGYIFYFKKFIVFSQPTYC